MEDDNNVMQDESILKRSQNSDNAYVNELYNSLFLTAIFISSISIISCRE